MLFRSIAVDRLDELLRLSLGGILVRMGQHDAEFVAAETADDVGFADVRREDLRDLPDDRVARGMSLGVVDLLEPVDVEIDDAGRSAVAFGERQVARQLAEEGAPVRDRRKRILVGELFEILDPRAAVLQLLAHPVHFLYQLHDGFLDFRRHFVRRDAEKGRGVLGKTAAGTGLARFLVRADT